MSRRYRFPPIPRVWYPLRYMVVACGVLAGAGVLAMVLITCADVIMRQVGHPLKGAYDMVRMAGGVTLAFALPVTTALKGHVAIEYFFQKLRRRGRLVVDSFMRVLQGVAFVVVAHQCWLYGMKLQRSGEVTPTLKLPIHWVPWIMAVTALITALVTLFQLVQPRRRLIKP